MFVLAYLLKWTRRVSATLADVVYKVGTGGDTCQVRKYWRTRCQVDRGVLTLETAQSPGIFWRPYFYSIYFFHYSNDPNMKK